MNNNGIFRRELLMALGSDDTNEIIDRLKGVLEGLAPDERNVFIVPVLITKISGNDGCVIINGDNDGDIQNDIRGAL